MIISFPWKSQMLKYILMSACSCCRPHMAFFRIIIMLRTVFCVFGSGYPPSAVPLLLRQLCFCGQKMAGVQFHYGNPYPHPH